MAKKRRKGGKPGAKKSASPSSKVAEKSEQKSEQKSEPKSEPVEKPAPEKSETKSTAESESAGQRRRREAREARGRFGVPAARVVSAAAGPVPDPWFWFGFEIAWAKLVLARFVIFTLLAIDAILQFSHAPRYGAGDFNVAQLPLLDFIAPGRSAYAVGQLVLAYLLSFAALGAATRYVLPAATAIYGWLYFSSHLDSYQHHYLVWLVLLISCFVPWERPAGAEPSTKIRAWGIRLILVQLALLYLWAAISKMSPAWFDGRTLGGQIHGPLRKVIDATIGIKGASMLVVVTELSIAATIWTPRAWFVSLPLGIALHAGILVTDLEIGLFAWLMLGMYILVVPDRVWVWLAEHPPLRQLRRVGDGLRKLGGSWFVWILCAALGVLLAAATRFDHGALVGLVLLGVFVVASVVLRKRVAIAWLATAHLLAFTTWTIVDRKSQEASDYYRLWGGSSRRLGDLETSEYAYRKMTEIDPENGQGFFQLGRLLLQRNADEEGIAAIRKAQELEPLKARAYTAEAKWLSEHGKKDEAIAKAREATILEPQDNDARTLLDTLLAR